MSLTVKVARARAAGTGPGSGDPGLFGFLGSAIKKVAGIAKIIPGPIGFAAGAISKFLPNGGQVAPVLRARLPGQTGPISFPGAAPMTFAPQQPTPGFAGLAKRLIPGGETGYEPIPATNGAIGSPAGYHVNESDYFLKDGTFVPAGSRWVKNRKRNPLNPKAASKAIGRIEQLKRATARFSRITIRKKCCDK
jgi:hypothetical protein